MPLGLMSMTVFIAVIVVWVTVLKRNMAEAMILGFLSTALFAGAEAPAVVTRAFVEATESEVLYAGTAFVFMAYLVERLGIMQRLVDILSSALGRLRGGPALVDTVTSAALGALAAGSNTGNAAASGSITGPWMMRSGYTKERTATVIAGNAGFGAALPPSVAMVIMVGFASSYVSLSAAYVALLAAGGYQLLIRLGLVYWFVRRDRIQPIPKHDLPPLRRTLGNGWASTLIIIGAILPISLNVGPIADYLAADQRLGEAHGDISIITWIPVLMMLVAALVAWRDLPKTPKECWKFVEACLPRFYTIIIILFFAIAASTTLEHVGLSSDVENLMSGLDAPMWMAVALIGAFVVIVAGPLTGTATVTAVGQVSFFALLAAGVDPLLAVIAILVCASTEGASAPASGAIYVASGLTGAKPESMFIPLLIYYVAPFYLLAIVISFGILPIPGV